MQDYLDPKLIARLLRPIDRPGVINTGMGWEIVRRSQKFTNRLPLISHLTQRWNRKIGFQGEQIPIVYAQPQPQITAETGNISTELSQSSTPQRTVVQAKFAPDVSNLSTLTPKPFPIQGEESQTTNSVGWVEATKPNSTNIQGKGNQTTNLIAKPNNMRMLGNARAQPNLQINPTLETSSSNQKTVVQAKFVPDVSHFSSLTPKPFPIQGEGSQTTNSVGWVEATKPNNTNIQGKGNQTINSVGWVEATKPNSTNIQGKGNQTINLVTKPNNMRMLGFAIAQPNLQINPILETSASNQRTIVQAKFATASDRSILPPNPQSQIPNSIGWSGLRIPLVFSSSGVNTESAKTELAVPNPGITGISRTEGLTQTAGLSKEVSSPIQSDETFNIQPDRADKSNIPNPLDLEALTDKIEHKLMQRLIVESERRGRNRWS